LIDLTAYCPQPVKRERRAFLSKLPRVAPGRFTGCGQYAVRSINQFVLMSEPCAETLASGLRMKSGWDSSFFFFNWRAESYT